MSTQLQDLQVRIRAELAALRESLSPPVNRRISVREKLFTLPDGTSHQGPMQVVILDHRNLNRYYSKPFDASKLVPPECTAVAKRFEDLSPHNHAEVELPAANTCATCAHNAFGSAPNGKGKACRNMVRLAIVPPDAESDAVPMTLEIPPSALKNWNQLVNDLEANGLLPIQVVTLIDFDQSKAYPCPTFKVRRSHDELQKFWVIRERATALLDQSASA